MVLPFQKHGYLSKAWASAIKMMMSQAMLTPFMKLGALGILLLWTFLQSFLFPWQKLICIVVLLCVFL